MVRINLCPRPQPVWTIYRLTSPSGKVYIGQTIDTIQQRWREHKNRRGCLKIHGAIKKYGPANFLVEKICSAESWQEADRIETRLIEAHDSIARGYNITAGGRGRRNPPSLWCKRNHYNDRNTRGACAACEREGALASYHRNREKERAASLAYYHTHQKDDPGAELLKERSRTNTRKYRQRHPERVKQRKTAWRIRNKEKINAQQRARRAAACQK